MLVSKLDVWCVYEHETIILGIFLTLVNRDHYKTKADIANTMAVCCTSFSGVFNQVAFQAADEAAQDQEEPCLHEEDCGAKDMGIALLNEL